MTSARHVGDDFRTAVSRPEKTCKDPLDKLSQVVFRSAYQGFGPCQVNHNQVNMNEIDNQILTANALSMKVMIISPFISWTTRGSSSVGIGTPYKVEGAGPTGKVSPSGMCSSEAAKAA